MSRTFPFDAAQGHLRELVEGMVPGEELVLTAGGEPIAIVTRPPRTSWPCQPGSAKDTKHWMAPDCGAPLEPYRRWRQSNLIECTPLMPAGLHDVSGDGAQRDLGPPIGRIFKSAAAHLQFEMRKFESPGA